MYLKFTKVRYVKSPQRAHPTDSGFDIFIPEEEEFCKKDPKTHDEQLVFHGIYILKPNESILIPSGLKIEVPLGYSAILMNKSGIAAKESLLIGSAVIDTDYMGEWHIDLHNVGQKDVTLQAGMKIVQVLLVPVLYCDLLEVKKEEFFETTTGEKKRGTGGFGSTGT